jgi:hypothetical protein
VDWWAVVEIVVGASITVGIVVFAEHFRKPRIRLRIDCPADAEWADRPARSGRMLRLIVENANLPGLVRWLTRNPAVRCYGFITFHYLDGQDIFGRPMPILWSNLPGVQQFPDGRVEAYALDSVKHIDIHAGYSEPMQVAARFDDDEECYGWCYDTYFSNPLWRNPDWKLGRARYLVRAEVICASGRSIGLFRLMNDVPVKSFRLEPALPEGRKKVQ